MFAGILQSTYKVQSTNTPILPCFNTSILFSRIRKVLGRKFSGQPQQNLPWIKIIQKRKKKMDLIQGIIQILETSTRLAKFCIFLCSKGLNLYYCIQVYTIGYKFIQQSPSLYQRVQVYTIGSKFLIQGSSFYYRVQDYTLGSKFIPQKLRLFYRTRLNCRV